MRATTPSACPNGRLSLGRRFSADRLTDGWPCHDAPNRPLLVVSVLEAFLAYHSYSPVEPAARRNIRRPVDEETARLGGRPSFVSSAAAASCRGNQVTDGDARRAPYQQATRAVHTVLQPELSNSLLSAR